MESIQELPVVHLSMGISLFGLATSGGIAFIIPPIPNPSNSAYIIGFEGGG